MRKALPLLLLALAAGLPALSLLGHPGAFLAGPHSEVCVKLFLFDAFRGARLLGGVMDGIGFPNTGMLNNPDPLGTAVFQLLQPLCGDAWAWNLLVIGQIWATMAATWLLARELCGDRWAAVTAALGFGLTPLLLVYPLLSGVPEILHLWPYPLALRAGLRALSRPGWRDGLAAGAWAGVGVVTCPYDAVVFGALAFPLLLWLPVAGRQGLVPSADPGASVAGPRQLLRALLGAALGGLATAGWYVVWMKLLMSGPDSQISADLVEGTRHLPPYRLLHPSEIKRYTAFLGEYFATGAQALVVRDMVSRFYRAFSPGFSLMALALAGVLLARGRRRAALAWPLAAVFAMLASTGPFLPWSAGSCLDGPTNPFWLALYHLLPGAKLLLEPLRYGFAAALALALAASVGVALLARRLGGWVAAVAPALFLAELLLLSPVPVPLPVASLRVSDAYARLDEVLPPGPILDLPYFDRGTQRFQRMHMLQQLVHRRPIPDEVVGFPPRYLVENQFTATLLATEKPYGALVVRVVDPSAVPSDRARLARDGFVGIVVDPSGFDSPARAERVLAQLAPLGDPVQLEDRLVYVLSRGGDVEGGGAGD